MIILGWSRSPSRAIWSFNPIQAYRGAPVLDGIEPLAGTGLAWRRGSGGPPASRAHPKSRIAGPCKGLRKHTLLAWLPELGCTFGESSTLKTNCLARVMARFSAISTKTGTRIVTAGWRPGISPQAYVAGFGRGDPANDVGRNQLDLRSAATGGDRG